MRKIVIEVSLIGFCLFALIGCGGGSTGSSTAIINGTVSSGGNGSAIPLAGATVSIYQAQASAAYLLASGVANATGAFTVSVPTNASGDVYYATASKGGSVELVAILGVTPPTSIVINELTTIASAYAMAQFIQNDRISGPRLSVQIAAQMAENLVFARTGAPSSLIQLPPNADQTNTWRELNTLANILTPCVRGYSGACSALFAAAPTRAGVLPATTLQAITNIAHNPGANVATLFALGATTQTYTPYLEVSQSPSSSDPTQSLDGWTLAVKFNNSGSPKCPWAGPANPAFDQNGYAWIGNNVVQGTPNSTDCFVVLKPNGQPADGTNNTVSSPVYGGGILGSGFGMAIDPTGDVWEGNFGWGESAYIPGGAGCPETAGSISHFTPAGVALSPALGWVDGTLRPQGMASDQNGNIWIANYGNSAVVVFPKGNPAAAISYNPAGSPNVAAFGLAIASDGTAWVGYTKSATLMKYALVGKTIVPQLSNPIQLPSGSDPKGVAVDSLGNVWIAASGGAQAIYAYDSNGNALNGSPYAPYTGGGVGGVWGPWGISIDAKDNIWVAAFGGKTVQTGKYGVMQLCGAEPANCPPGSVTGSPISPNVGYTLPSAGDQVLLNDETPLYDDPSNLVKSYKPLMRMTQVKVDMAGNVWAMNNWKPSSYVDLVGDNTPSDPYGNPGGDGVVIFVGLGAPTKAPAIGPSQSP
jgi:hypothetical protein